MARQFVLPMGLLVVLGCACVAQAARPKPDCSNTFTAQGTSLSTLSTVCGQVSDPKMFAQSMEMSELNKLETVESCSCALINHDLAWASLMTYDAEVLYSAVIKFAEQRAKRDAAIKELTKAESASKELLEGVDGERRFLWDALGYILQNANGEDDDEAISLEIREFFAKQYYDPISMKTKYAELVQSQKLRSHLSGVCNTILRKFGTPFLPMFSNLSQLAGNDQLFFTLTAYNDDLYKLRMNSRACLYLIEKGQLLA